MKILGSFEELVLLAVGSLRDQAYGVAVKDLLTEKGGKTPSIGALHSALHRLEDKGMLDSWIGGATSERGGRRKKYYSLTPEGKKALQDAHDVRAKLSINIQGLKLG